MVNSGKCWRFQSQCCAFAHVVLVYTKDTLASLGAIRRPLRLDRNEFALWLQAANAGLFLVYNEVDDDSIVGAMNKRREVAIKYSRILDVLQ